MEITFDPAKNESKLRRHGVPLSLAESFEWETSHWRENDRALYGELRFKATGFIGEQIYVLVFCPRGDTACIISLRKALPREARHYANHHDSIRADHPFA